ncbi:hypothetical protein ES705_34783 [subsurface metagenome]
MGRAEPITLRVPSKTNMIVNAPISKSRVLGKPIRIAISLKNTTTYKHTAVANIAKNISYKGIFVLFLSKLFFEPG